MTMPTPKDIVQYYQSSQWLYQLFCYDRMTLGMHFGFWEPLVTNRRQAMSRENDAVIALGHIQNGMRVLDAGCGVGGTAIHIARKTGARVTAITLDPKQVSGSERYARASGTENRVSFRVMDFHRMEFPDSSFDVVYAIESVDASSDKPRFLTEAFRVLKPGGRLVIMDVYAARKPRTREERQCIASVRWGFVLPPAVTGDEMTEMVKSAGFARVRVIDKTRAAWPSVGHFGRLANAALPLAKLLSCVPSAPIRAVYRNAVALAAVTRAFELGLGMYAIHVGRKPRSFRAKR